MVTARVVFFAPGHRLASFVCREGKLRLNAPTQWVFIIAVIIANIVAIFLVRIVGKNLDA